MDNTTFSRYATDMRQAAEQAAIGAGLSATDAEDVASETMLSLWMIRNRLIETTCIAYARVTAQHKALNNTRDNRSTTYIHIADEDISSGPIEPSAEDSLISREEADWLLRQIDGLPSTQQAIIRLRHIEMMEKDEIAQHLGITVASVSTLLSRARKTMYNAIEQRNKR